MQDIVKLFTDPNERRILEAALRTSSRVKIGHKTFNARDMDDLQQQVERELARVNTDPDLDHKRHW